MIESKTKERRIWYFPCKGCTRGRAQSHKKKKAVNGLCQKCRKIMEQNEGMTSLFQEVCFYYEDKKHRFVPGGGNTVSEVCACGEQILVK